MRPMNFIVTANEGDEVAVGYILDRAGAEQSWVQTHAGMFCDVAIRIWPFVKLVTFLAVAWMTSRLVIHIRRAPGE